MAEYVIFVKGYLLHNRKFMRRGQIIGADKELRNKLIHEEKVAKPYKVISGKREKLNNVWNQNIEENAND